MQVRIDVEATDPEQLATLLRAVCIGAVAAAVEQLRLAPLPALYRSGVVWQNEPNAGKFEEFALPHTVYRRGWGDCDDLVIWRCAELWIAGRKALPKIYWRTRDGKTRAFHAEVRLLDTRQVEDPSRLLGMTT